MVSDKPIPGRCGAKCYGNIGLEVRFVHEDDIEEGDARLWDRTTEEDRHVVEDGEMAAIAMKEYYSGEVAVFEDDEIDSDLIRMDMGSWDISRIELENGEVYSFNKEGGPFVYLGCTGREKDVYGFCEMFPMKNGRCYRHGGAAGLEDPEPPDPQSGTAPRGNTRAMTHGLRAKRSNYYEALDEDEQALIDMWFDSFIQEAEERGLFTRTHAGKVEMLRNAIIDLHKIQRANEYIGEEGLVEEIPLTDDQGDVVHHPDTGEPIMIAEENTLNLPVDRLKRTFTKQMKELGMFDDPESQNAEATDSLASQLSQIVGDG